MQRIGFICLLILSCHTTEAFGQVLGTELHNMMMPASGGMGGVSIARPQDLVSAMNANPSSLSQFRGTQFMFGGGWAEPTFNLSQTSNIPVVGPSPLIEPFSGKSTAPGVPVGNIGVSQDFDELGIPATLGVGFITTAGDIVDFRQFPESNGTNAALMIFSLPVTAGIDLTDRWSIGASMALGIAFFDGPFVGLGGMTPDYALRGTIGTNYLLNDKTTVGGYYQTEQSFTFDNAFQINSPLLTATSDVAMDLPQNIGFGIANSALMDGRLLLATDVLYKLWDEADLFEAIYDNQLAVQFGGQYTLGRYRLRTGYVWAQNPIDETPGGNLGGVVQPGDLAVVRYSQALLAVTSEHRISFGLGVVDILPGVDFDVMGGGMFLDNQQLGNFTNTSIESYWLGLGLTWRSRRGSCDPTLAPDSWSVN